MALFDQYTKPGVYTDVTIVNPGIPLFNTARIPVIIGEGQQSFTYSNVELHRGSAADSDETVVGENLSSQANGEATVFQVSYYPIVTGDGTDTLATDPSQITVTANGIQVAVASINGAAGQFTSYDVPAGSDLVVNYAFKRTDTLITNQNLSYEVPTFATLTLQGLALTLSIPGAVGNGVTVAFTLAAEPSTATTFSITSNVVSVVATNDFVAGQEVVLSGWTVGTYLNGQTVTILSSGLSSSGYSFDFTHGNVTSTSDTGVATPVNGGVPDVSAVTVTGNAVSIELRNSDGTTIRTMAKVASLINVLTLSAGYITVVSNATPSASGAAVAATAFSGGSGQNTNTTFTVQNVPITDGTNSGQATTNPADVTVLVNGVAATVVSVDGAEGQFTLANGVTAGATLEATFYTNTWQNTFDVIPASTVTSITEVGLSPNRADFIQGIDYVLTNGNQISWGAAVNTAQGSVASGNPFNGLYILTTLKDSHAFLRQTTGGVSNSVNQTFTLADVPVDGSGLGNPTFNPSLIKVYVGTTPIAAFNAGPVTVVSLNGDSATIILKNPPPNGSNVYASYYRSLLKDHTFTLTATDPASNEYTITDENSIVVPVTTVTSILGAGGITSENIDSTIVWPYSFSDLKAAIEGPNETVTVTFQNDGLGTVVPGTQASVTLAQTGPDSLIFQSTNVGTAPNGVVSVAMVAGSAVADGSAVTVTGNAISINITGLSATRTIADVISLFAGGVITTPLAGAIICTAGVGTTTSDTAIVHALATMSGGTASSITNPYANRFKVTSSLSNGSGSGTSGGQVGYLDQTYVDSVTGLTFTLVNPADALSYGYVSLPGGYVWQPGDIITISVSNTATRVASQIPTIDIPGVWTEVEQFFNVGTGNTAVVSTFNTSGNGPTVGEYYYITYTVAKQPSDYALQIFTTAQDAYAAYGQPSATNRLSLGIYLMTLNGAQTFGAIQVPQQPNSNYASDAEFIAALGTLTTSLPGVDQKAGVIVPMSTSSTVQQALSRQLTTQATVRNRGEAIGFIGFNQFATPTTARQTASAIANQRVIAVAPFYAACQLPTQDLNGNYEVIGVTGEFLAAALAGLNLNAANDVATTLTLQKLVGFTQLLQRFDDPTNDLMAGTGITVLYEDNGALVVRDYLTTDPSNPLTSEPTSTTIVDYVRQNFRSGLKQFIARKFTSALLNDIQITCTAMLTQCVANEILGNWANLTVVASPTDPTVCLVTVSILPIFSLKYIQITFAVTTQLS
jgi:hypothetical protein